MLKFRRNIVVVSHRPFSYYCTKYCMTNLSVFCYTPFFAKGKELQHISTISDFGTKWKPFE